MSGSGEFDRIARHFAPLAAPEALGLLDDAAVITPKPDEDLVTTVDQMIESVHFLPEDRPDLVARKLLRRNLSDIAAMGARPLGYLLTTALRKDTEEGFLARFAEGLAEDQVQYGIGLFGGDSTSTPGPLSFSVTMFGAVPAGRAVRRAGARPGDLVIVTGTLGDAALGLAASRGRLDDPTGYLVQRRLLPEPPVGLPIVGFADAAIDISDGLLQDLGHVCRASGVAAEIEADRVPASAAALAAGDDWFETRLQGGDDYELVLAVPASAEASLRDAAGTVRLSVIGRFVEGAPSVTVRDASGQLVPIAGTGWRHF